MNLFTSFKRLGRHSIVYGFGSVFERLGAIILLPLYTNALTAEEFGLLGLLTVTGTVIVVLFSLGSTTAMFRSYFDYSDNHAESQQKLVISTTVWMKLPFAAILIILAFSLNNYISERLFQSQSYSKLLIIVFFVAAIALVNEIPYTVFRIRMQATWFVSLRLFFFIFEIGLIVYLVALQNQGVEGVLVGRLVKSLLAFLVLYILIRKDLLFRFSMLEAKKMLNFGYPLALSGVFGFLLTYADRYLLNHFASLSDVGLYSLAYSFGFMMMVILVQPLKMVMGPFLLSLKDDPRFKELCSRTLTYVILVGGLLFLGIALLSGDIIKVVSAPEFWAANKLIPVIALTYLLWSMRTVFEVGVMIKRTTHVVALYTLIGAVANVLFNLILIPRFGMMGAAIATLFSFSLALLIDYYFNQKIFPIRFEWKRIAKIFIVIGIVSIIVSFIEIDNPYLSFLTRIFIILIFYPLLLLISRFVANDEARRISFIYRRARKKVTNIENRLHAEGN